MNPFEHGYAAGYKGLPRNNPHTEGEAEYDEWENGYKSGSAIRAIARII